MDCQCKKTIEYLDKRLNTIDRYPKTWGSPESLEFQTLLMLEIREFALTGILPNIRQKYIAFTFAKNKNATNEPLHLQIKKQSKEEELNELAKLLGEFRDLICKKV